MHSLLRRQIRKNLPEELKGNPDLDKFFNAIEKSYEDYDDKIAMIQRATTISAQELKAANIELAQEAQEQKKTLQALEQAVNSLNLNLDNTEDIVHSKQNIVSAQKLAKHISKQAEHIALVTKEKDNLVKDLEEQNKSLNNYAHVVSHDLKSPMRNINTLMSWIVEEEKHKFTQDSINNCDLISQNLVKMDKLVSGILKHATIGNNEEAKSNVNISLLLKDIKSTIYIPKNVTIKVADNLPTLFLDKYRLEQLFMNLLTNAVKATEHLENGIVNVDVLEKPNYWQFSIKDNGKGIPQKYLNKIFEMFKKLDNDVESNGIGLALVEKIVTFYGGKIWVDSKEDEGTVFYFTIKKN
ncbi:MULTISPECIES: sensor histidine kinase [Cellulophaga]|uniref:histidine kinase n=2 Tax=Cellulophaga TaxID=104264 RepID=F0RGN6_CELLC|nr:MULTISPECIES: HAMP domain-containing sensor histidine kinase [Cellulophaga]ADY29065.1 histidine kinase [Cellulophaga lytica DSM 7489]AIM60107.1 histidine kinase [Cellulophaga lytica]APU09973.1 histidine kinase [Cellulophaga lytica]EWH13201.1 histidine kinase [Cellulophaga geojensis KL-A]MDO6854164.1 ATP-binding protein [Cellulophaga lytica]